MYINRPYPYSEYITSIQAFLSIVLLFAKKTPDHLAGNTFQLNNLLNIIFQLYLEQVSIIALKLIFNLYTPSSYSY